MNNETKRLAAVAMVCFFPTASAGLFIQKKSPEQAVFLFRLSIYFFLSLLSIAGFMVVIYGGRWIEVIGAFF